MQWRISRRSGAVLFAALLCTCVSARVWADAFRDSAPVLAAKPSPPAPALLAVFEKSSPEDVDDLRAIQQRVQELVGRLTPATVNVQIGQAQGSGVIVSEDGYVLTAAHVAGAPGRSVRFLLSDGRRVSGRTLGVHRAADAALLKITDDGPWPYAPLGDSKEVDVGTWCLVLGHPGGYQRGRPPVLRLGRVIYQKSSLLQTDCTLVGGDSGGPLFDMYGRVIGVHSRIGASTTWNFHVPVSAYTGNWDRLVAGEVVERRGNNTQAVLGVRGVDVEEGCRVTSVVPGLPAAGAGLEVGDVIVRFDRRPVDGFDELAALVQRREPGEQVTVVFLRAGERHEKSVVLARRSQED